MSKASPTPRHPPWGFYGTISHRGDPSPCWLIAMNTTAETIGRANYQFRAFLDSHSGRRLAGEVGSGWNKGQEISDAITHATARWMDLSIRAQTPRETDKPCRLPDLMGLVINEGSNSSKVCWSRMTSPAPLVAPLGGIRTFP